MKITKEKSEQNRAALVQAASRLFREKGVDGVGVAEISKAAGLTHGALYAHFPSKEALAVEAMALGVAQARDKLYEGAGEDGEGGKGAPDLEAFLDYYLDPAQRDDYGCSCVLAASASEIGRQDQALSEVATGAFLGSVNVFEARLRTVRPEMDARDARPRAMALAAAMVGAVAMARATVKSDPAVSETILRGAREMIGGALAGSER
jgi:TetR/AcrR family transcriptional repressor of nem operon